MSSQAAVIPFFYSHWQLGTDPFPGVIIQVAVSHGSMRKVDMAKRKADMPELSRESIESVAIPSVVLPSPSKGVAHKDALPEPHRSEAGVLVDHCMVILCDLEEVFLEVRTDGNSVAGCCSLTD